MEKALEISNLKKIYKGGLVALKGIDLNVNKGDFFALLGPNGAGKSTTIGIISSLVKKTSGNVKLLGIDIDKNHSLAKKKLGVVGQEVNFNQFEKVGNIILNQAGYHGINMKKARENTEHFMKRLDIWDRRDEVARTLSGGMKRRVMVAKALVNNPELLILDEPTAGVDLELRRSLWEFLIDINKLGTTIILTTHYLEEAEQMCDRIAIINQGDVVACDETHILMRELDQKEIRITTTDAVEQLSPSLHELGAHLKSPRIVVIRYQPSRLAIGQILSEIDQAGISVADLSVTEPALEDLFLEVTGKNGS